MQGAFFLNVVVRQSTTILKLLASKDESLLVRRNAFLVLNLGLDILNGVRRLDIECDCLSCERANEYLHHCHS